MKFTEILCKMMYEVLSECFCLFERVMGELVCVYLRGTNGPTFGSFPKKLNLSKNLKNHKNKKAKTTASSIPAWSPTAVLTGPFHA